MSIDPQFMQAAKELIVIESTTANPGSLTAALDMITTRLAGIEGLTIERFERNGKPSILVYKGAVRPEKFDIVLNGHVDVVPAQAAQFNPREEEGRLYGRGALDMKVAALVLTDVFASAVHDVSYTLGLQIVTDEETGGKDGTAYQIEQGVSADFVIAGEFTPRGTICTESRGVCWVRAEFAGLTAHSAYLWNGTNAVLQAQEFTSKLLQDYPIPAQDEWRTTINVASVTTSNTTFNRVPDQATVLLDIRYVAGDEHFATEEDARAYLSGLAPGASIDIVEHDPDHYADPANAKVQALARALQAVTGSDTTLIHKHGASDVRFYSADGSTAVVMGLQGEGLHGDDEYLQLTSVQEYFDTLDVFLKNVR